MLICVCLYTCTYRNIHIMEALWLYLQASQSLYRTFLLQLEIPARKASVELERKAIDGEKMGQTRERERNRGGGGEEVHKTSTNRKKKEVMRTKVL